MTTRKAKADQDAAEWRTNLAQLLKESGIPFEFGVAPVDHVHANPWNYNTMDDRTQQATRESVAVFGFIDPVTVRAHPELDGHYQVIDGEHRLTEARELGLTVVPLVILDVDTPTAQKLSIVLNETRGKPDEQRLGTLLVELQQQLGEQFQTALRWDPSTLEHLLDLGRTDWQGLGAGGPGLQPGTDPPEDPERWVDLQARVPASVFDLWREARDEAGRRDELREHDDPAVAAGLFLEVLLASYMALPYSGPADEPE